jgi:serine O-acetyltransferase
MDEAFVITANKLRASYSADKKPYLQECIRFPAREYKFKELMLLQEIFFPNYFCCMDTSHDVVERLIQLYRIIYVGASAYAAPDKAESACKELIIRLPDVREMIKLDVESAFAGDPAAKDYTEIIRSYPGMKAILVHRVAHIIYNQGVPGYAREMAESIHMLTGIDIHPGAKIGRFFFIDHGTGVVIGETCEIGDNVRLYQGVTLGVLHFEKGEGGILKKGYKRHPSLGNNVIVGAGAKLLGPISVGSNVSIGANSWIQEDVPDNTAVYIKEHPTLAQKDKK